MWPFRKPSRPSRRDVAAAFGQYLSAEFIEQLADKKPLRLPTLQSARVDFVLIALADELWEEPRAELDAGDPASPRQGCLDRDHHAAPDQGRLRTADSALARWRTAGPWQSWPPSF